METTGLRVVRLSPDYEFKPFDCGNDDLNEFLFNDSKDYLKALLAVTYIIETEDDTVAYFSVSNDKITTMETRKSLWRKIKSKFDHRKHRRDYPAVKVARLAVNKKYQNSYVGTYIMDFIKQMFVKNNRTGCAFITVDALQEALNFYIKNGFRQLDTDQADSTVHMYYNLQTTQLTETC